MSVKMSGIYKDRTSIMASIIIEIFYLAYFLRMIVGGSTASGLILYGVMSSMGIASLIYILILEKKGFRYKIFTPIILFILFGLIASLYTGNYRIEDFIIIIQYFGVGILLLKYKLNYKVIKFSFILYALYFLYYLVIGKHPDDLFNGFSRNNIIVIMILHITLLYISMFQNKIKITFYPAIIPVVFSFWAIGRSGILTSILLLVILVSYSIYKSQKKFLFIIPLISVTIAVFSVLYIFYYDAIFSEALERTNRLGIDDVHRQSIISEYFDYMQNYFGYLFWGVPIYESLVFSTYNYNLHNSYLRLHAFHGIFGTFIMLGLIAHAVFKYIILKEFLYLGLLIVLLVRMSTDIVAFHGPFDPLLYFFVLNSIVFKQEEK